MEFINQHTNYNVININTSDNSEKQKLIDQYLSRDKEFGFIVEYIKNQVLKKLKYDNETKRCAINSWYMKKIQHLFFFDVKTGEAGIEFNDNEMKQIIGNDGKYTDQSEEYNNFLQNLNKKIKRYQDIVENVNHYSSINDIYNYLTLEELYYMGF